MDCYWSLSDSKSLQTSRTLLSILDDLINALVWMVSTRPLISKASSPWTNPLMSVPGAPTTTGNTVTFGFHSSPARLRYYPFFTLFQFYSVISRHTKVQNLASSLILLTITRPCRLAEIKWSICISKSQRSMFVSFPATDSGLCIYHLLLSSNLIFSLNSQRITLQIYLCLVSYSFCASLLHSLIMWMIVSFLSSHDLYLLICCVLSILALIWLVLMALFWVAIRRVSVSFISLLFCCHIQVFSSEMSLVCRTKRCFFYPIFVFLLFSFSWSSCGQNHFWWL